MKNKLIFMFIFAFILSSIFIKAQEDYLPPELEGVEKLRNVTEKLTDEETREEYLKKEWAKILLENKVIAKLDSFFTKYSIFFKIILGVHYSLSLTMLFVIILWVFVAAIVGDVLRKGLGIFEGFGYVLGIVAAVMLAQLQILRRIAVFLVKLMFYPEAAWARFIVFVVVIAILVLLYYFKGGVSQALEERRKKRKEQETELRQEELKRFTKGVRKGAK